MKHSLVCDDQMMKIRREQVLLAYVKGNQRCNVEAHKDYHICE